MISTPAVGARCALGLAAELFEQGLREGTPPHLTARAEAIDRQVVGALRCPACCRSGMSYHPFTDGRGHYAVLAVCRCGTAQEV
jgi:hypothetical protein